VNNTKLSIQDKIAFVNTTLNNVNFNITTKIAFVDSLINNTKLSLSTEIGLVNDTLNNVNFNLTTKISFVNSLINSTTLSISNKILYVNTLLNNTKLSISTKISYVDSLLNNTQISLSNRISYANTLINNTKLSISTKVAFVNDTLSNLNLNLTTKVAILNSTLNNVNLNATTYFQIEHDLIFNMNVNTSEFYHLENISGTNNYHFIATNVTVNGTGLSAQIWIKTAGGQYVNNKTLVTMLTKNFTMDYYSLVSTNKNMKIHITSIHSDYFDLGVPMNTTEITNFTTINHAILQMVSPFMVAGSASNLVVGNINPSVITTSSPTGISPILQLFGFTSPPPALTSFSSIIAFIGWLFSSDGGRLLTLLSLLIPILYYTWRYSVDKKNKVGIKDQLKTQKELHETYKMVKHIHDHNEIK
jgi:hypothetical protein